jgi:hypothetical protein
LVTLSSASLASLSVAIFCSARRVASADASLDAF